MTTCEIRVKAAEIIETRGWIQRHYFAGPDESCGGVCLLGALNLAASGGKSPLPNYDNGEIDRVDDALVAMGFYTHRTRTGIGAHAWNDNLERTQAEVLARLREGCQ